MNGESRESANELGEVRVDLEDEELLERARSAENGDRFDALWRGQSSGYDSHSEADMALCLHLAFWTGGDPTRMDALFRQSGLKREKWDEVHYADGATYGERTVERALGMVDEFYEHDAGPAEDATQNHSSGTTDESNTGSLQSTAAAGRGNESVYLKERNRLLREKIQSQAATIERQRDRIAQLEDDLEQVHDRLVIQKTSHTKAEENRDRFWGLIWNR